MPCCAAKEGADGPSTLSHPFEPQAALLLAKTTYLLLPEPHYICSFGTHRQTILVSDSECDADSDDVDVGFAAEVLIATRSPSRKGKKRKAVTTVLFRSNLTAGASMIAAYDSTTPPRPSDWQAALVIPMTRGDEAAVPMSRVDVWAPALRNDPAARLVVQKALPRFALFDSEGVCPILDSWDEVGACASTDKLVRILVSLACVLVPLLLDMYCGSREKVLASDHAEAQGGNKLKKKKAKRKVATVISASPPRAVPPLPLSAALLLPPQSNRPKHGLSCKSNCVAIPKQRRPAPGDAARRVPLRKAIRRQTMRWKIAGTAAAEKTAVATPAGRRTLSRR